MMKVDAIKFHAKDNLASWQVSYLIICSLLLVTWFKHDRLSDYWQQTYQSSTVWNSLNTFNNWQLGVDIPKSLNAEPLFNWVSTVNTQSNDSINQAFYADFLAKQKALLAKATYQNNQLHIAYSNQQSKISSASQPSAGLAPLKPTQQLTISADKQVFFAGDSLMQGVAPWVMRELQSQYSIKSINLSKQSTGLSYSSFFDWPATIETTLDANPDIGALVIFLGPNDPWAVPDPNNKYGKYIEFATPRWNELYKEKIQRILTAAQNHHVQVLWLLPPAMKKPKLNGQMDQLKQVIQQSIAPAQALVLDTRPLLENHQTPGFADSLSLDGKLTKVRTADGIHFTADGQKLLANAIVSYFNIK